MRFSIYNDDNTGTKFLRVSIMRGETELRRYLIPPPAQGESGDCPYASRVADDCHLVVRVDKEWFEGDPGEVTEIAI